MTVNKLHADKLNKLSDRTSWVATVFGHSPLLYRLTDRLEMDQFHKLK